MSPQCFKVSFVAEVSEIGNCVSELVTEPSLGLQRNEVRVIRMTCRCLRMFYDFHRMVLGKKRINGDKCLIMIHFKAIILVFFDANHVATKNLFFYSVLPTCLGRLYVFAYLEEHKCRAN